MLHLFGDLLHNPNLWHLNRRSVAGAFAVGLFTAFMPIPFQMVLAAGIAIVSRVNLPISVILVWISNPLTMPPMFYSAYKLGQWLLGRTPGKFDFELSMAWLTTDFANVWKPFLLGCLLLGAVSAMAGYATIRLYWRYLIVQRLEKRRLNRNQSRDTKQGLLRKPEIVDDEH